MTPTERHERHSENPHGDRNEGLSGVRPDMEHLCEHKCEETCIFGQNARRTGS